ncbi:MAG: abortive infection protein [Chitinophagaceae bacterium]
MKKIWNYLKEYYSTLDKRAFLSSVLLIALFIFFNYYNGLSNTISTFPGIKNFFCWYVIFLTAFALGYIVQAIFTRKQYFSNKRFLFLLLIVPAIFAWKMMYHFSITVTANHLQNAYWNAVLYYPFKLIVVAITLFILWRLSDKQASFYGVTFKNFNARPYALMLLIMIPLIAAASTQHDFLNVYPKLNTIAYLKTANSVWYKLLYELAYGSDFFTIELFFRGFLILAFIKFAGKGAILPMAMFYCTIHFGKPLGECISSFFGGIILGVVTYHTRTIFGGLIVHLGIAWMMELGGYLGHHFF